MIKKTKKLFSKKPSKIKKKIGASPGTITYTGEKETSELFIEVYDYNEETVKIRELDRVEEGLEIKTTDTVTWINVNGLRHVNAIEKLGDHFELHPLLLEDIVNVGQRPKLDEYENCMFAVFKMLYYNTEDVLKVEQVSMVLGDNYVLTFQEADGDVFEHIRNRIKEDKGRIRKQGADYLLFCLMDAVVDNYFLIMETLGEKIEDLEEALIDNPNDILVHQIQRLKRESLNIRRSIFPLREVVGRLEKSDNHFITENTQTYYRDLYDHTIQVIETIETYRDMLWGLMDMYMSSVSNKMNNIMKVLTIIATIFIPLTFIVGVYGMNFENMPELHYKNGYYTVWGIMILIFIGMIFYFKRKKWL
ncbi:magnesium/cobalt transporter CorA [Abyssalbus ytuae]|uniref:Magnesium transport protein CorA n=1 Tax=Abyssalbus ytuae TaxID=2926907 RepID=A0A9E6ZNJ0_9FLAO|nr:magnesium/cobalt transporter CorA [Abyssalbus ytuae]UOB17630.1 magnesium/cobalt transporter CorA [Abyssalbus ytuae]